MSKSKKSDVLLEEKIERIRLQNEKIKQRHLEVEADKQEAEKLNAMVNVKETTEDWTCHKIMETLHQDMDKRHRKSDNDSHINMPYESGKKMDTISGSKTKKVLETPESKRDDQWRKEREQIDKERISRQKTPDGRWRREWDEEKIQVKNRSSTTGSQHQSSPKNLNHGASMIGPPRGKLDLAHSPRGNQSSKSRRSIDPPSNFQGRPIVKTLPPAGSYNEAQHNEMPQQKSSSKSHAHVGEVSVNKAKTPQQRIKIEPKKTIPLEVITNDIRVTPLPQDIYNKEPKAQRSVFRNRPVAPNVLDSDDSDDWEDVLSGDEKQSPNDLDNVSREVDLQQNFCNFKITVDVNTNVRALSEISPGDMEEVNNVKMPIQQTAEISVKSPIPIVPIPELTATSTNSIVINSDIQDVLPISKPFDEEQIKLDENDQVQMVMKANFESSTTTANELHENGSTEPTIDNHNTKSSGIVIEKPILPANGVCEIKSENSKTNFTNELEEQHELLIKEEKVEAKKDIVEEKNVVLEESIVKTENSLVEEESIVKTENSLVEEERLNVVAKIVVEAVNDISESVEITEEKFILEQGKDIIGTEKNIVETEKDTLRQEKDIVETEEISTNLDIILNAKNITSLDSKSEVIEGETRLGVGGENLK